MPSATERMLSRLRRRPRRLRPDDRRAAGLPDLANGPAGSDIASGRPGAAEGPGPVPVVDPAEALDVLFEDDADRSDAAAGAKEAGDGGGGARPGAGRRGRTDPVPCVNLKHGRGDTPDDLRVAFRELCRQPRIDGLLQPIDALIEPLERSAVPDLEAARRGVEALRRREVAPERLGDPRGEGPGGRAGGAGRHDVLSDREAPAEAGQGLGRLDFSDLTVSSAPRSFWRLLRQVEDDPVGNAVTTRPGKHQVLTRARFRPLDRPDRGRTG